MFDQQLTTTVVVPLVTLLWPSILFQLNVPGERYQETQPESLEYYANHH